MEGRLVARSPRGGPQVHYAEWNAYLAPRWQAHGHNIAEKRPGSPPASDLSCADRPRSEADTLTWKEDAADEPEP